MITIIILINYYYLNCRISVAIITTVTWDNIYKGRGSI